VYTPSVPEPGESALIPSLPQPSSGLPGARRRKLPPTFFAAAFGVVGGLLAASGKLVDSDHLWFFVLGVLVALNLHNVLGALLSPLTGLTIIHAHVGLGRRLGETTVGGVLVTFRLLPLVLFSPCAVITDRPGLVRRLWWGTALQVLLLGAAGGTLAALGGPGAAAVGWGFLFLAVPILLTAPTRVTSPAWRLWRMPSRREAAKLDEWRNDAAAVAAARALGRGRVDLARAALDGAPPSDSPRRQAVGAMLAIQEGGYEEAAREAAALYDRSTAPSLRGGALYLYARALSDGVQAAYWPADHALPLFAAAITAIRAEAPALLAKSDLAARDAYYRGDAARALRLARRAVSLAPERLSLAAALRALADAQRLPGAPTHS
jgi:hypothetical protein